MQILDRINLARNGIGTHPLPSMTRRTPAANAARHPPTSARRLGVE